MKCIRYKDHNPEPPQDARVVDGGTANAVRQRAPNQRANLVEDVTFAEPPSNTPIVRGEDAEAALRPAANSNARKRRQSTSEKEPQGSADGAEPRPKKDKNHSRS